MKFLKQITTYAMHSQLSKLDSLYQCHAGEECYIFGDGISLKWMDLHQFADKPSILGNMSIFHREAKILNAPYCTIIEPFFFYPIFPYWNGKKLQLIRHFFYKEYKKSIAENLQTLFLINLSNYPVARFPNALFVSRWYKPSSKLQNLFSERDDSHQGTLKFQLALAIFLGFKKAYLVGHDYTHSSSRSHHFYEKGEGISSIDLHRDFSRDYINHAKQCIDLVTVTLSGGSNTMNSITYKELTGQEPKFRENTAIVDRVKLESLATWHEYTVF